MSITPIALERRVAKLEAQHAETGDTSIAARLRIARTTPFTPLLSREQCEQLADSDDLYGRVARGWLRLGDAFLSVTPGSLDFDPEQALIETCGALTHDPYRFVLFAFDWGYGELSKHAGPRQWQRDALRELGDALALGALVGDMTAIQRAISSGHASGKSALVAWLIIWALSTFEDTRCVTTANTEPQLRNKTFAELSKWHYLSITEPWFESSPTSLVRRDNRHVRSWRADALPWSENRPEAFAGLHNQGKRTVLIFDEASAIPPIIWETAEGALTDEGTELIWLACGNPTRSSGRFFDALRRLAHRWKPRFIDTRKVEGVLQAQVQTYIDDYGIDSDYVRVRVLGLPPRASSLQFIPRDVIDAAQHRALPEVSGVHAVVAVDVARYGDDKSVIRTKIGMDARSIAPKRFTKMDTMTLADEVDQHVGGLEDLGYAVTLLVDGGGVGGGVIDRLRQLGRTVHEVQFGSKASDERYANTRCHMYGLLRDALKNGLCIEDDSALADELASIEYAVNLRDQIQLERKEVMKARGLKSPDDSDALALLCLVPDDSDAAFGSGAIARAVALYHKLLARATNE
jgi:hypothetical protein